MKAGGSGARSTPVKHGEDGRAASRDHGEEFLISTSPHGSSPGISHGGCCVSTETLPVDGDPAKEGLQPEKVKGHRPLPRPLPFPFPFPFPENDHQIVFSPDVPAAPPSRRVKDPRREIAPATAIRPDRCYRPGTTFSVFSATEAKAPNSVCGVNKAAI